MAVVQVPKTPPEAYDSNRAVSSLLISQIQRLQQVVLEQIQTEGQAAEYIKALTKRVWASHSEVVPKRFGAPSLARTAKRKSVARKKTSRKARTQKTSRKAVGSKGAKKSARSAMKSRKSRR
jgi:hypothetical protein